ncbi:MAG: GNAT family N-acetyltransferase [Prevotellaceae bacterium]|jgi:predicted N-acetyltransferase YhbS|nr:GNAT family N-acetyltransferase [Prevotellaceae bacterium]
MLDFATKQDISQLKAIWKIVFKDTDFFVDLYFSHYFVPHNTLVFRVQGKIVAMLFMNPYDFRFCGDSMQCYYLSGLATLPMHRRQGIMCRMLTFSYRVMRARNIPLAILIPASKKMYPYYQKFNYEQVFEKHDEIIPLGNIVDGNPTLVSAYAEFNSIYREKDFCIQKEYADFQAIVSDWEYDRRPPKTDIAGMAQLIAPHFLFNLFKQRTGNVLSLNFSKNNDALFSDDVLTVNNRTLCRLLFGFRTSEFSPDIAAIFPERQPVLNLMLE